MSTSARMEDVPLPSAAALDAWRPRATQVTLVASLVACLPIFVLVMQRDASWVGRAVWLLSVAALLALALLRRVSWRRRAALMVASCFACIPAALLRAGLGGTGRTLMVSLPVAALFLLGRRAGAVVLVAVAGVLALFSTAAHLGWLPPPLPQGSGRDWLLQSLGVAVVLLPLFALAERALSFQEVALRRAEAVTARLRAEAEERRRLERQVIEASERESRRIGSELHDGLCQQLSAALLSARLLERSLCGQQTSTARRQASALAEIVDAALDDARSLARGLSPGPLPAGGLGAALRELARQVRETVDIDCRLVGSGTAAVEGGDATQLYRIAQEATQNAVKHAAATLVEIELFESGAEVGLAVRDDGRGLPPQAEPGLGLRSMMGRAVSIGGTLEIRRGEQGGTTVVCRIPRLRAAGLAPGAAPAGEGRLPWRGREP